MESEHVPTPPRRRVLRRVRRYWLVIALLVVALWSYGFFALGQHAVYANNPQLSQATEATRILTKVGALIQLPPGETPSMATITDAASAKKVQPFLVNAQNGDVLIVYSQAGEALLYRPSTDKLVAVGPVNQGSKASATVPTASVAPTATTTHASTTTSRKK